MVELLAIMLWWIFGYALLQFMLNDKDTAFEEIINGVMDRKNAFGGIRRMVTVMCYVLIPPVSPVLIFWVMLHGGKISD